LGSPRAGAKRKMKGSKSKGGDSKQNAGITLAKANILLMEKQKRYSYFKGETSRKNQGVGGKRAEGKTQEGGEVHWGFAKQLPRLTVKKDYGVGPTRGLRGLKKTWTRRFYCKVEEEQGCSFFGFLGIEDKCKREKVQYHFQIFPNARRKGQHPRPVTIWGGKLWSRVLGKLKRQSRCNRKEDRYLKKRETI